jgi:hypothetical protein
MVSEGRDMQRRAAGAVVRGRVGLAGDQPLDRRAEGRDRAPPPW